MTELEKLIAVKDLLIATQKRIITAQDVKIATLEDNLAAANTVIAECRQFIDSLTKNETVKSFEDDLGRRYETTT